MVETFIETKDNNPLELAVDIVAGFVGHNTVAAADLPGLIETVYGTLSKLGLEPESLVDDLKPAVPIKRSVTSDYIVCLEDGRKFKSLKRHLRAVYDLTPEAYREK